MDAARTPFVKSLFFVAIALLLSVSAWGQISVNGGSTATVALNSATTSGSVAVTSTGAPANFTMGATVYGSGDL
ncbi:MAG: hypothetical protein EHM21_15900, partial [Chloroflexi bacterium]